MTTQSTTNEPTRDDHSGGVTLKRRVGLIHGIAVIVGMTVGGGIFITPQNVLLYSNSVGLTLCMWALGGVLSLVGSLCYSEIGITYPIAGEKYAYLDILYGPYFAFAFMWQYLLLMRPGGNAIKALMCARYLLKPLFPTCQVPELIIKLVATVTVVAITFLNCRSVKGSLRSQSIMTASTIASLSLLAVVGIVYLASGKAEENITDPFQDTQRDPSKLIIAFHSTLYSYFGGSSLNFLIEELKNPKKNLPLAIISSLMLTTIFYVLVNLAYIAVLGKEGVLESEAVAISVAMKVFGTVGWFMSIMIATTACSSFNSGLLVGSRLAHVGARRGHLPKIFACINIKYFTPIVSVIFQSFMSLIYIWLVDVFGIINNLVFCALICDFFVILGFIKMRSERLIRNTRNIPPKVQDELKVEVCSDKYSQDKGREDTNQNVLKMPLIIYVIYIFLLTFLIGMSLASNPVKFAAGFAIVIAVSTAYYVLIFIIKPRIKTSERYNSTFSVFVQKLLLCAEDETKYMLE